MPRRITYAALLRGVNLGARNRVRMPELRALVEALGGTDIPTYVQSGNVVFRSDRGAARWRRRSSRRSAASSASTSRS